MDILAGIERKGKKVRIVVTVDEEINEILEGLSGAYGTDKNRVLEKIIKNLTPTLKNRLKEAQKQPANPKEKSNKAKEESKAEVA